MFLGQCVGPMCLAHYLHDLSPFLVEFSPGVGLRWYGLAYAAAFLLGYVLFRRLARRGYSALPEARVGEFITWCALAGVFFGGRLGYFVFYQWELFASDPWTFFRVWEGGMSSHGGILGLVIVSWIYARRARVPWLNLGDNLVVVAPVGLFLGRCANFINGELYGRMAAVPWAMLFPSELYAAPPGVVSGVMERARTLDPGATTLGALIDRARENPALADLLRGVLNPRHPSQLYEALLEGAALFAFLYWLRTRCPWWRDRGRAARPPAGFLTGIFFIGYAAARIFCERFREPDAPLILGFTRGQALSFVLVAIGVAFLAAAMRGARTRSAV